MTVLELSGIENNGYFDIHYPVWYLGDTHHYSFNGGIDD